MTSGDEIRHLKYLAPFSIVANILMFVAFAICLYYIFSDTLNVSDKRLVGDIDRFPAYLWFKRHMFGHVPQKYKIILQVLIISLVGALFYSTLGLIIPAVVESVFRWEDLGSCFI
ncbi:Amino acid transporter [Operophtera brumata]|uniref:Amino acid transporter n=1 Tax=Operophtera brumata TaxID=104452 RepID=A0A0L7L3Z7_OPEBR|nr:Amino acid transporter [Operophtera brumata]